MNIRKSTVDDIAAIHALHHAAIRTLCANAYPPDVIGAWTAILTPDRYSRGILLFEFLVAEEGEGILGFAVVNPFDSELDALYVHPSAGRRGIGSALLRAAERLALLAGVTDLGLKATLNAVSFYERSAYVQLGPAVHKLPTGQGMACVQMHKPLGPLSGAA